jgi:hypothetical protein
VAWRTVGTHFVVNWAQVTRAVHRSAQASSPYAVVLFQKEVVMGEIFMACLMIWLLVEFGLVACLTWLLVFLLGAMVLGAVWDLLKGVFK